MDPTLQYFLFLLKGWVSSLRADITEEECEES